MSNENIFSRFWHNINKILVPRNARVEETNSNFVVTLQNAKGEAKEEREDLVTFNIPKKISPLISDNVHVLGETNGYRNDIDGSGMHIVDVNSDQEVVAFATDGTQINIGGYRNNIDSTGMHITDTSSEQKIAAFATDGAQISVNDGDVFNVKPNAASETKTITEQIVSEAESVHVDESFDLPNMTIIPNISTTITYNLSLTIRQTNGETFNSAALVPVAFDGTTTHTGSVRDERDFVTINVRVDKYGYGRIFFKNYTGSTTVTILPASTRSYSYEIYGPQLSFGLGTSAASSNQTVLGRWNIEDTSGDYALIIGNGTSTTYSNALTVNWDGDMTCGMVNGTDMSDTGWTAVNSSYPGYLYRVKNGICYISLENVNFTTTGTHTLPALPESARPSINVQPFIRGGTTLCGAWVTTAGVLNIGVTTTGYHAGFGCWPVG